MQVALECEVSRRAPTIGDSLAAGFADEQLDAHNTFKCDRCKQQVRAGAMCERAGGMCVRDVRAFVCDVRCLFA